MSAGKIMRTGQELREENHKLIHPFFEGLRVRVNESRQRQVPVRASDGIPFIQSDPSAEKSVCILAFPL
ncbi:hypothetical protein CEXT_170131 [Caerostris extrusa]|uniref:Uncharacterized protein n=1 Tax=Caerostris extrusa TaxID=172846 RepID=A0AAV4TI39_CAEEX|nr:hypothetical protein CEXT_170131 [Caerostris extrusa]